MCVCVFAVEEVEIMVSIEMPNESSYKRLTKNNLVISFTTRGRGRYTNE
jgi:hypothetical protein